MFVGPIFTREAMTVPRQLRHYLSRSGYVGALFVLIYTLGQVTFGWQQQVFLGELARFGNQSFQILSLLQLTLVMFFSLLFAAGNVSQEKDRKTMVLLIMTDLRNQELVLGKLAASLLMVGVLIGISAPVFVFLSLLGGVMPSQIGWVLAIAGGTGLAAGSWGSLMAFWREKTFQTLAWSVLGLVLFLGIVEGSLPLLGSTSTAGQIVSLFNPYRGMMVVLEPQSILAEAGLISSNPLNYVLASLGLSVLLSGYAVARVRVWNPSDALWMVPKVEEGAKTVIAPTRRVWNSPIIWREICTSAYGKKVFVIKLAYLAIFLAAIFGVSRFGADADLVLGMISPSGFAFVGLSLLSLVLMNAQSVTSMTTERDAKTLEILLVTDVTAKEFIYGKLGGAIYNAKEVILLPLALAVWFAFQGLLSVENLIYVVIGFLVLSMFSVMLGLHSGLSFENSRMSIANSLGTMFFLFLGIFICMILILEARSSFWLQLPSFLVFILGGSLALATSLTHKNPSPALTLSAFILPFFTFYAITSFLLQETLGVCLVIAATYGFTTLAMLVPAVSEFDVALGRTTLDRG
ncbi:MAG: ABC transporter permease [Planctomycetaceae bacterium]|nr:ABC transporter permease [Planctomycetaceae bacterium]